MLVIFGVNHKFDALGMNCMFMMYGINSAVWRNAGTHLNCNTLLVKEHISLVKHQGRCSRKSQALPDACSDTVSYLH